MSSQCGLASARSLDASSCRKNAGEPSFTALPNPVDALSAHPRVSVHCSCATGIGLIMTSSHHALSSLLIVHLPVMSATEWNGELVADLASECSWFGKAEVVSIARCAAADEARL